MKRILFLTYSVGRVLKKDWWSRGNEGFLKREHLLLLITSQTPGYFNNHHASTVTMVTLGSRVPSTISQDFFGNQEFFNDSSETFLRPKANSIYNSKIFWNTRAKFTLVESVIKFVENFIFQSFYKV